MKLKDLRIGIQLTLGFSIILILIVILGYISWQQSDKIADQTADLYDHPLTVRRALGELKADVLYIRVGMKEISLAKNELEINKALQNIEHYKTNALKQFDILNDRYLGPKKDLKNVFDDFLIWNIVREETIHLRREGQIDLATARSKIGGAGVIQAEIVLGHINALEDFAKNKGDEFMQSSNDLNKKLNQQMIILIIGILALSLLIISILARNIRRPLAELTFVAKKFKEGNYNIRSDYKSNNEYGILSSTFNNLAETIESEFTLNNQSSDLSNIMLSEDDPKKFFRSLINNLILHTNAQVGAVYLLDKTKSRYVIFDSIGMDTENCKPFSSNILEGDFGKAIVNKKIQHLKNTSNKSRFSHSTIFGTFTPSEIITIPISSGSEVSAVISLATINTFHHNAIRLMNTILNTLSARMDGILAYKQLMDLSTQLESQNSELQSQKKELSSQTNELTEQNIELEMQKKQLHQANQMKTNFLSNMSHELRTPLNSVIALSGVLNRRLKDNIEEEEYSYLGVIERNGKQLLSLINNILDLSRIEAGHEEVELSNFKIDKLINEVIETLEPQANNKKIKLLYQNTEDKFEIKSDFKKCRHILQNLVGNSVKFTEEGSVTIKVNHDDDNFNITVLDTGIGISKENKHKVFEEFKQADDSSSRKYGGTGLGLTIAQKYANLLGGSIEVKSELGVGSSFIIHLPNKFEGEHLILNSIDNAIEIQPTKEIKNFSNENRTILLVEDTEAIIVQMKDMLTSEGYNILVAHNGQEAYEQIEQQIPDAMILDLMMPKIDGFEVLKKIRENEKTSRLPVIILTAKYVTKQELAFLKHNSIHQIIQKGDINKDQLLNEIAQMIPNEEHSKKIIKELIVKPKIRKDKSKKPIVLIVEDNKDNMLTIKALLKFKYEIFEAEEGIAAIELAKLHQPDLILMDYALPGMNGIEVLEEIRKIDSIKATPIIAVSASAMKGDRENFLKHGFNDYISKPIDSIIFDEIINKWID